MANLLFPSTGVHALDIAIASLTIVVATCIGTYIFTECRFWLQSRGNAGRYEGREPITLPYSIPYLAGFIRLLNPHAMYEYALNKAPQNAPVLLPVGPIGIYILFGDKNLKMIFKNSKVLSKHSSSKLIMKSSGMRAEDQAIFASDESGIAIVPEVPVPEEKRIWKKTHDTGVSHLASGPAVNQLTNGFMKYFSVELNKEPKSHEFTVPLWDYVKKAMFTASTTALVGTEIFRVNPGFVKTYWEYDESFLLIAIGLPKLIYWQGHARRDRMLHSAEQWLESAYVNYDERDKDSEWEPMFGSAYLRNMLADMKNVGISTHGQAAALLSIIWAINSNAVPCAVWILLETLQRPGLIDRLRSEIAPVTYTNASGELTVDIPKLISQCPLLTSTYQECLRTRASNTITRRLDDDLECDGYVLKKGRFLMSPSWLPMHGPLWDIPGHPAKDFWAERFMEMPKMLSYEKNEEGKTRFDIAMKPENWFPYGGGNMICTGRFFAKQEILVAAALLIMKFDFEPQEWIMHGGKKSDRPARPDEAFAGSGILPPDRDLMVKMRRVR